MCLRRWECARCWVSEGLKLMSEAVPRAGSEVRICAGGGAVFGSSGFLGSLRCYLPRPHPPGPRAAGGDQAGGRAGQQPGAGAGDPSGSGAAGRAEQHSRGAGPHPPRASLPGSSPEGRGAGGGELGWWLGRPLGEGLAGSWSHGALSHGPTCFHHLPSPSWRHTTLWPPRPMRLPRPALAWTPPSATSRCLPTRSAWWASARPLESIW